MSVSENTVYYRCKIHRNVACAQPFQESANNIEQWKESEKKVEHIVGIFFQVVHDNYKSSAR